MLLNLINDLLDLAKQEKFTFQFDKDYFDLQQAVNSAFNTLQFLSKKKGITTRLSFEGDSAHLFRDIYGDKNRFEQIFINFISNALKFTPTNGTVEVFVKCLNLTEVHA